LYELFEGDLLILLSGLFPFHILLNIHPDGVKKVFGFLRISLKTLHDGVKIRDKNASFILFVKQIKDFFQILNFFV
jgi:hypothetical protein